MNFSNVWNVTCIYTLLNEMKWALLRGGCLLYSPLKLMLRMEFLSILCHVQLIFANLPVYFICFHFTQKSCERNLWCRSILHAMILYVLRNKNTGVFQGLGVGLYYNYTGQWQIRNQQLVTLVTICVDNWITFTWSCLPVYQIKSYSIHELLSCTRSAVDVLHPYSLLV